MPLKSTAAAAPPTLELGFLLSAADRISPPLFFSSLHRPPNPLNLVDGKAPWSPSSWAKQAYLSAANQAPTLTPKQGTRRSQEPAPSSSSSVRAVSEPHRRATVSVYLGPVRPPRAPQGEPLSPFPPKNSRFASNSRPSLSGVATGSAVNATASSNEPLLDSSKHEHVPAVPRTSTHPRDTLAPPNLGRR